MSRRRRLAGMWGDRVGTWHEHVMSSAGFELIRDEVLAAVQPADGEEAVDLGAGTGFLALPLAQRCRSVIAVDVAPQMTRKLAATAERDGITNVDVQVADIAVFDLPKGSADIVVSNYALHHLSHADKRALLVRARRWLRPGGRIVIADMMFGRGVTAHDRRILVRKVGALLQKGPGGLWRIVKNLARFGLGVGSERPASPQFWLQAFQDAGFEEPVYTSVVAEAGIVTAVVPGPAKDGPIAKPASVQDYTTTAEATTVSQHGGR